MYEREDTGHKYPDGTPVYVGDRIMYDRETKSAKVYGRTNAKGKRVYFIVIYENQSSQRQIILDKITIRGQYYKELVKRKAVKRAEIKAKAPNPKQKYIHGFLDYDHLDIY